MLMKSVSKFFLLIIGIMGLVSFCCYQMINILAKADRREKIVAQTYEVYAINSDTILNSLADGDTDVFVMLGEGDEFYQERISPPSVAPPIQWYQTDFMTITDEFVRHLSGESLYNWDMHRLIFWADCTDADFGPQRMNLKIFKEGTGEDDRIELNISLQPRSEQITRWELSYSPYLKGEALMPLDQIKIPVERAFEIAEENGGMIARQFNENECAIRISLVAGVRENDWDITYQSMDGHTIFDIWVDEKSGKAKIIQEPGE